MGDGIKFGEFFIQPSGSTVGKIKMQDTSCETSISLLSIGVPFGGFFSNHLAVPRVNKYYAHHTQVKQHL